MNRLLLFDYLNTPRAQQVWIVEGPVYAWAPKKLANKYSGDITILIVLISCTTPVCFMIYGPYFS